MATYYIDFENGNDANTGLSFAQRWKTITNGATLARIGPGDEIRIMASPDPTSIGNATWTGGGRLASASILSSTNATPIVITASAAHGLVPGDYVMITGHTTNTNANGVWKVGTTPTSTTFQILQVDGSNTTGNGVGGGTGNFTKVNNCIVKTASPLVQNIALCGGWGQKPAWTGSTNVISGAVAGGGKEGYGYANISVNASFTTGKAAYYTLPSTIDLSGYQQVAFWVQLNSGTVGADGSAYVALCTDTTGDVVVHQCPVPNLGAISVWVPITVNLGTNLNSAIRSVAFYIATDNGAQSFYLDNIIACKAASSADSLNLQSLISKSDGTGDEAWYAIQSINYDAIMLANYNSLSANSAGIKGYGQMSETVTTYKRETIKTAIAASATDQISVINDSGSPSSKITFSGGWNRTDMSTQTGRTWLDGLNGNGYGIYVSSRNDIIIDKLDMCRYNFGAYFVSANAGCQITSMYSTACSNNGIYISSCYAGATIGDIWVNNGTNGIGLNNSTGVTVQNVKCADGNSAVGVDFNVAYSCSIGTVKSNNCGTGTANNGPIRFTGAAYCTIGSINLNYSLFSPGIYCLTSNNCSINGGSTSNNIYSIRCGNAVGELFLNNVTLGDTTEVSFVGNTGSDIYTNRLDDTDGNNWVFNVNGTVNQQTSVVDSPATTAWKMSPTSINAVSTNPIKLKLCTVVCAANRLVTVTARMRRSNVALTMRLVCPGGQISGVSSDVTSDMTVAANTWETVTITFTPTKPGGVEIYAYAFGGTTYSGYVCNLTASQA